MIDLRHEIDVTGCRRLWALIRGLPVDAAVRRDGKLWTQEMELHATALERADVWGHRLAVASRAFKKVPEMPKFEHPDRPKPRPAEPAERRMSTPQEIMAFMRKTGGEVKSG
jgi:hypothetical protein